MFGAPSKWLRWKDDLEKFLNTLDEIGRINAEPGFSHEHKVQLAKAPLERLKFGEDLLASLLKDATKARREYGL